MIKLREIAHSRTGDKGNTSNISVIAYDEKHYPLLLAQVTSARVKALFAGVVEGDVVRYELPNIAALNFVMSARSAAASRDHWRSMPTANRSVPRCSIWTSKIPFVIQIVACQLQARNDGQRVNDEERPDPGRTGRRSRRRPHQRPQAGRCVSRQNRRQRGRGRAGLHSCRCRSRDRSRRSDGPAARGQGGAVALRRHSDFDQGPVRHQGAGDPRRFARARRFCPGGSRRARSGAAAPGRFCGDRPHQHDRIRLFRHGHQSALRHAEGRLEAQRRPCARRIVVGRGGFGRRRHGAWRARHRHRRLLPDSGGL